MLFSGSRSICDVVRVSFRVPLQHVTTSVTGTCAKQEHHVRTFSHTTEWRCSIVASGKRSSCSVETMTGRFCAPSASTMDLRLAGPCPSCSGSCFVRARGDNGHHAVIGRRHGLRARVQLACHVGFESSSRECHGKVGWDLDKTERPEHWSSVEVFLHLKRAMRAGGR